MEQRSGAAIGTGVCRRPWQGRRQAGRVQLVKGSNLPYNKSLLVPTTEGVTSRWAEATGS